MAWPYSTGQGWAFGAQPGPRALTFVAGQEGAEAHYVGPGEAVALFDTGSMTCWIKAASATGMPSMERYRLVADDGAAQVPEAQPQPQPVGEFVTRDEMQQAVQQARDEVMCEILEAVRRQ